MEYVKNLLINAPAMTVKVNEEDDKWASVKAIPTVTIMGVLQNATLDSYLQESGVKKERKKPQVTDNGFEQVWQAYPPTASFSYRGMKFTNSSRVLRTNKAVCEQLYLKGIAEYKVTGEQILAAVKKQIEAVKEESYETGQNRMQFLPALEPWLRQQSYMALIEAGSQEEDEYEPSNNCA
jgi:hypothetical protein